MSKLAEHNAAYAAAVKLAHASYDGLSQETLKECLKLRREMACTRGMTHEIVAACEVIYELLEEKI